MLPKSTYYDDLDAGETLEERLMRKTRTLTAATQKSDSTINDWINLINLQDEFEKKVWDTEKVQLIWENIISQQGTENAPFMNDIMWDNYINFCLLSKLSSFSIPFLRETFIKITSILNRFKAVAQNDENDYLSIRSVESLLISLFFRLTCYELQSGYSERAIGLWQSLIEFNECCFEKESSTNERVFIPELQVKKEFLEFWDAEVPRIGESEAKGWSNWKKEQKQIQLQRILNIHQELESKKSQRDEIDKESRNNRADIIQSEEFNNMKFDDEIRQHGENLIAQEANSDDDLSIDENIEIDVDRNAVGVDKNHNSQNDKNDLDKEVEMFVESVSNKIKKEEQLRNEVVSEEISKRINSRLMQQKNDQETRHKMAEWSKKEEIIDYTHWCPLRLSLIPEDESEDELIDSIVLSTDIQNFLFKVHSADCSLELVYRFLLFLGAPFSHFFTYSDSLLSDCINASTYCSIPSSKMLSSISDYRQILKLSADSLKTGSFSFPSWIWNCSSDNSYQTLGFSLWEQIVSSIIYNNSDKKPNELLANNEQIQKLSKFISNSILGCLKAFPDNSILIESFLLNEARIGFITNNFDHCHQLYKDYLSKQRNNTFLWCSFAKQLANEGKIDGAIKVFEQTLSLAPSLSISERLELSYVQLSYAYFLLSQIQLSSDKNILLRNEMIFESLLILLVGAPFFIYDTSKKRSIDLLNDQINFDSESISSIYNQDDIDSSLNQYAHFIDEIYPKNCQFLSFNKNHETALYSYVVCLYGLLAYLSTIMNVSNNARKTINRIFCFKTMFKYRPSEQADSDNAFIKLRKILELKSLPYNSLGKEIIAEFTSKIAIIHSLSHITYNELEINTPRVLLRKCCETIPGNPILLSLYASFEFFNRDGMKWREWTINFSESNNEDNNLNSKLILQHNNPVFWLVVSQVEETLFSSIPRSLSILSKAIRSSSSKQNVALWQKTLCFNIISNITSDDLEMKNAQKLKAAKALFSTALRHVPWSKSIIMTAFSTKIKHFIEIEHLDNYKALLFVESMNHNELNLYKDFMEEKMIRIRTPI